MNILEITNLSKEFGEVKALRDVSLNIEQGQIYGLLGPNGAGKTTLLRIVNGIMTKDSGSVKIAGEEINLQSAQKIGYMPEERGLYDNMTIDQQIMFFGELKGGNRMRLREVMHEYLDIFNITDYQHKPIKELSKGNQQKVQIISTLVHEPDLVIFDEPFSGFDPINGHLLQELIKELQNRGTTIILSSHNMPAIEEMCDSIALINKGELILQGRIDNLKEANKTNHLIMTASSPLQDAPLRDCGMIASIAEDYPTGGRKGFAYKIEKLPGVSNSQLLTLLASQTEIIHFEEALPSLNQLFIKYTANKD